MLLGLLLLAGLKAHPANAGCSKPQVLHEAICLPGFKLFSVTGHIAVTELSIPFPVLVGSQINLSSSCTVSTKGAQGHPYSCALRPFPKILNSPLPLLLLTFFFPVFIHEARK